MTWRSAFVMAGTATAGVNFFRSMGGAFGVAIFGAILSNRLNYYLPKFVPAESLAGINTSSLRAGPEALHSLPTGISDGVVNAFAQSLQSVYLYAAPLALVCFILAWLLPELALHGGRQPASARGSEAAVADEPKEAVLTAAD